MVRQVDLIQYLPLFIAKYKEIQHIMNAENPEFQFTADEGERIKDNQFIVSCDFSGIARFERLLKITPSSEDTLESRISRVLIRWNDVAPYTWKVFLQKMDSLCGTDFEVYADWGNYLLEVITHLDLFGQVNELEHILDFMMPANIQVISKNNLNYKISGNAFVGVGIAFCDLFDLTDSFKVNWSLDSNAGVAVIGSGTCGVTLSDSFNGTIQVESDIYADSGISFTEII